MATIRTPSLYAPTSFVLMQLIYFHTSMADVDTGLVFNGFGDTTNGQCTGCAIGFHIEINSSSFSDASLLSTDEYTNVVSVNIDPDAMYCAPCPTGTFSSDNSSVTCTECPIGHSQSQPGRGFCEPCTKGFFAPRTQSAVCTACPSGQFQNETAKTGCILCKAGTYTSQHGSTNCSVCELGTYSTRGAKACRLCPAGSFGELVDGMGTCVPCPYSESGRMQTSDVLGAMNVTEADCKPLDTIITNCSTQAALQCADGEYLQSCSGTFPGVCKNCSDLCPSKTTSYHCTHRNPGCCALWGESDCSASTEEPNDIERYAIYDFTEEDFLRVNEWCGKGLYDTSDVDTPIQCTKCPNGTYNNETASTSITDCKSCTVGKFSNTPGAMECKVCIEGFTMRLSGEIGAVSHDEACDKCPRGSSSPTSATGTQICEVCPIGSYSNRDGGLCILCPENTNTSNTNSMGATACTCDESFERDGNSGPCTPRPIIHCESLQIQPDKWSDCTWCIKYQIPSADLKSCLTISHMDLQSYPNETCSKNQVTTTLLDDETGKYYAECVDCPLFDPTDPTSFMFAGDDALVAPLQCSRGCRPGSYIFFDIDAVNFQNYTCPSCPPGFVTLTFNEMSCTPCAAGSYSPTTPFPMRCDLTPAGFYQSFMGQTNFSSCPPGTSSLAGASECEPCPPGTYNPETEATVCIPTPEGYTQQDYGQISYNPCPPGTSSQEGASECSPCGPGTYNMLMIQTSCMPCGEGTSSNATGRTSECPLCPGDTIGLDIGLIECVDVCLDGEYPSENKASCRSCPRGSSGVGGNCTDCKFGEYQDQPGQTTCKRCSTYGTNQYQPNRGQVSCLTCMTGLVLRGNESCGRCGEGSFFNTTTVTCDLCATGEAQPLTGQTGCNSCNMTSSYPVALQNGSTECSACPLGSHPSTTSYCEKCGPGTYGEFQNNCTNCPSNTIGAAFGGVDDTVCIPCPDGTSTFGVTGVAGGLQGMGCGLCPARQFSHGNECHDCERGSASNTAGAMGSCELCSPGYFADQLGSYACDKCIPGTIAADVGSETCTPCPSGFEDHPSGLMQQCVACTPGTRALNFECVSCTHNQTSSAMATTCVECPITQPTNQQAVALNNECVCPPDTTKDAQGVTTVVYTCQPCDSGSSTRGAVNASVCQWDATTSTPATGSTTDATSSTTTPIPMATTTTTTPTPMTTTNTTTPTPMTNTTTTTPIPMTTTPTTTPPKTPGTVLVSVLVIIPLTRDNFTDDVSYKMRAIFARLMSVDISRVTVSYIGVHDNSAQRRLLSTGIRVLFVIDVPVENVDNIRSVETIATTITTPSFNRILVNDTSLKSLFPNGIIAINSVEVVARQVTTTPAVSNEDSLMVVIIASVGGAVGLVLICLCVYLCCCRKRRTTAHRSHLRARLRSRSHPQSHNKHRRHTGSSVYYTPVLQLKTLDYKIDVNSIFDGDINCNML
jgi:hypothetical protein